MARGFSAAEMRITAGPVAGLVSPIVQSKIREQRTLFGSKYEDMARLRQGWPSALTREIELKREKAINPDVKFRDERNDPEFDLNQGNMEKMISDMPVEVGVLYDKFNRLISITKGSPDTVGAHALRTQFEGGTFIHNHPEGGPFSGGDLSAHAHYRPRETIALASEGRYSMKGLPDKLPKDAPKKITEMQGLAMGVAGNFALSVLAKDIPDSARGAVMDAKSWVAIEKALPREIGTRFSTIVNKFVGIETVKLLAKMGVDATFVPSANPPGYASYDEIPTPKFK